MQPQPELPQQPAGLSWLLQFLFGLSLPVGRRAYALTGFTLMLFKYLVEAAIVWHFTTLWMDPFDFANPAISMREEFFRPPAPGWLSTAVIFWSMPFLWIMVSMSVRRSVNAGLGGGHGLWVLVPVIGLLAMVVLCIPRPPSSSDDGGPAPDHPKPRIENRLRSALLGIAASLVLAMTMILVSINLLGDYGSILFVVSPTALGALSAFIYNRPHPRTLVASVAVANLSILIVGLAILLFAIEGLICLIMAYPLATLGATIGAMIGYTLAVISPTRTRTIASLLVCLPLLAGAESLYRPTPVYEVISTIEIDAPPEEVWNHVISFPPLPEPTDWFFRLGVACPQEATIEGSGVGAIRRCIFSTGTFVEPITAWEPGRRLSFDVKEQPAPMEELSPYRHLHPPHLNGYLQSTRGEFRLIRLPGGRTRLEGSTWYRLDMKPRDYWTGWTDNMIHRIHMRVLGHIKHVAEASSESH